MFHVAQMSDSEWDSALDATTVWESGVDRVGTWSPHNYSGWAHVKSLDGWESLRVSDTLGNPIAQVLTKRKGPVCVAYCPGGFAANRAVDANSFTQFLQTQLGGQLAYVRVHCHTPNKYGDAGMQLAGWRTTAATLGARMSLKLRLDSDTLTMSQGLSFNWRRNLRRAEKHGNTVSIDSTPSAESIAILHKELKQLKGTHVNTWESSQPHVEQLITGFGARLIVATCTSTEGVVRAVRGVIITGGCAFDILAAASMDGRKHYSSHITLWTLVNELSERGVIRYDLGGVDIEKNRGVYDFKSGTGAMQITYGGEFDVTHPILLRPLATRIATLRRTT